MVKTLKKLAAASVLCAMSLQFAPVSLAANDTTSAPGWAVEISNVDGGVYIDSQEKASGKNSMKLYNNTPKTTDTTFLRASYPVNVEKGKSYVYGFSVKAKNAASVSTQMNWITPRANLLPTGGTADWRDFEFNYNHTGEDGVAYLRIILDTKSEAVWLDDFYFYDKNDMTKNLISNPSFEDTAANAPVAEAETESADGRKLIPVYHAEGITVDGDFSDWEGYNVIPITQAVKYAGDGVSLETDIRYAYDDENFYFAVKAEDDVHFPILEGSYWNGDGLQFTICGMEDTFGKAYAYSYDLVNNKDFINASDKLICKFKREGTTSYYEVAIPWDDFFADGKPDAALFCCIINDNDDDGFGRKGCLEVSGGISGYKGSGPYPLMLMVNKEAGFDAWFSGSAEAYAGDAATYYVDLFNSSDKTSDIAIKSEKAGVDTKVTVPANSSYKYKFDIKYADMGEETVDLVVSNGGNKKDFSIKTTVFANAEITKAVIAKHKENYKKLTPLVNECKAKGMPLDYEEIDYNILGHFVTYMEEALSKNDLVRIHHQDKVLTSLYEDTKAKLESYLAGEAKPIAAPTYVTSDIEIVGKHFEATTDTNGVLEKRPVFFVGTGHWAPSREDIPILSKFGFNAIQPEVGGWSTLYEATAMKDWKEGARNNYYSETSADSKVKKSGNYSLKISEDEAHQNNYYWYVFQNVSVKPNTTYEYGLSAKADNAKFLWFTIDPTMAMNTRHWMNGTFDWTDHKYEYTTGPNETSVRFSIFNEDTTNGIWIDDAFFREKGSEKNMLENGDFEIPTRDGAYWQVSESVIENLAADFDLMAEYNLSGAFGTAPHYVPDFYTADFPEAIYQAGSYIPTILEHEKTWEFLEAYYRTMIPRLAGKPAFDSVVLMNEPQINSTQHPYYLPLFRNAMQEKYQTIEALNANWGTSYSDFSEIEMPKNTEATARFYDWRAFNDEILPDHHKKMIEIIKEYDPDVLMQTKVMQTTGVSTGGRVMGSNNWEIFGDFLDVNGGDGWAYYKSATIDLRAQDMYYDFQTSINEAPTYNTEEHIIQDGSKMIFNDKERIHNVASMWQGGVHGRGGSIVWFWDRETRSSSGNYLHNPLLTERPDTVSSLGKMTLDLNRLSKEVVAIQDKKADVGILWSQNSWPYTNDMMNSMYVSYAALGERGQKTQFIVESQAEKMHELKTLIIPHAISVTDATFAEIEKFVSGGGKLIVLGEDSLSKTEYAKDRDAQSVATLMSKATVVPITAVGTDLNTASKAAVFETIFDAVKAYSEVSIIDKATGKPVENLEYLYAECEGKLIVNICTYRDDDIEVEVLVNGKAVEADELISVKKFDGKIKAYTPVLLSVEK